MPPKVSVIVPVYNAERFLAATIESILAQTYRDFELILVDDGSEDKSLAICNDFAKKSPQIQAIHQENKGIAAAQNAGLEVANGRYITFCDCDDLFSPYLLERLVYLLESNNADIATCRWRNIGASSAKEAYDEHCAKISLAFSESKVVNYANPAKKYQQIFSVLSRKLHKNGEFFYMNEANWSKLYRRELWQGIRFPEGHFAQDISVAMPLYLRAKRVTACTDQLYFWLQHTKSTSHSNKSLAYHKDIFYAGLEAFNQALTARITPARSYTAVAREAREFLKDDANTQAQYHQALQKLSRFQRIYCFFKYKWRLLETFVYDRSVHKQS